MVVVRDNYRYQFSNVISFQTLSIFKHYQFQIAFNTRIQSRANRISGLKNGSVIRLFGQVSDYKTIKP
jgi:hypothetical protein